MTAADLAAAARAVAFTSRRLERRLGDMTLPQFRVLALVASSPERANRIAELAAVSRPSLTGLLDGLEARGWVRRVDVVGDRRGVLLEVTTAGTQALATADAAMSTALGELLELGTPDERAQVEAGLAALGQVLQAYRGQHHGTATPATPASAPSTADDPTDDPTAASPNVATSTTPSGGPR
jgi:DNA-binding MarR family transcriptional regulator